jgi:UDP-3-O-[3-hydroxymyristoyl] glucosamine N-acyltransferase
MNRHYTGKTASELAAFVKGELQGNADISVTGIAALDSAEAGDITFVEDLKLLELAAGSKAACLIVPLDASVAGKTVIRVKQPKLAFSCIAALLRPPRKRPAGINPSANVAEDAEIDATAHIGSRVQVGDRTTIGAGTQVLAGATIGDDVSVGRECVIHPGVVIYDHITIGDRVILHAGVVIGADGFGYVRSGEGYVKFPQVGTVVIEDDVEIGANSCIDRGALGRTRIGYGTKIDNLVQIAHNVDIGERVIIAAQTGISGSTVIEDDAVIGGQVGMGDHARVQSGAIIGSQAGVLPGKIVRPGVWWGTPVQRLDEYKRLNAHVNKLPQLREDVKELRRELDELKKR